MAFAKRPEQPKEPNLVIETPQGNEARFKALLSLGKKLNTKYETTNALVRLGDKVGNLLPSISTGLPTFDYGVIGTGGIPKGRMIEIFGPESAGKTSFTLHVVAECQKAGGIAAFIDAEHALDPSWASTLGVDVDKLVVSQPDSGEQALDTVDELVESQAVDLVVIDSVSALVPEAELAGEIGDAHVGLQARLLSQAMRILTGKCARNEVTVIWVNQIREKIGVLYGNPETTSGGRALKFYSSIRIDVRRKEKIKQGNDLIGHSICLKAQKNKCGVPFKETLVNLFYASGFDKEGSLIEYGDTLGIFEKKGSWFVIDGVNVANGLPAMKALLKNDPEALAKVKVAVEDKLAEERAKTEI